MDNRVQINEKAYRKYLVSESYRIALSEYRYRRWWLRPGWITWIVTLGTIALWCFTAYKTALAAGAHSRQAIIANILANAVNIQNNDALATVLTRYGAKVNSLIISGQYWRFVTPIFLHANLLHIALNMLNFFILGIFLERIFGHMRFLLIYLLTGIISIIASFYFAPQEVSVGASGAIFGLVGAYAIFVLAHRRALRYGGIPSLLWIVLIIGINLGAGLYIPNVDNYAHVGGFLSGCILGWWFAPHYVPARSPGKARWIDTHNLARRWFLALLTIIGTILLAIIAVHYTGG